MSARSAFRWRETDGSILSISYNLESVAQVAILFFYREMAIGAVALIAGFAVVRPDQDAAP